MGEYVGAFVAVGIFLAAQFVTLLIWGVMLEMRVRSCEKANAEFWKIRDTVKSMDAHLAAMRTDMGELMQMFKLRPASYEIAPGGSRPSRPPVD